ncbi:MAG TPA: polyhydroxyalkanoate synthesis repressor PhaR [Novosphingobium sp.]|nr:polyhydroxyalkanoate synthesis repressor PhaR [Novosphingobium sp.]HZV09951.1 polyhydroxyalkanoate synthesis repressor PhaR [Novosphingobium sp.]
MTENASAKDNSVIIKKYANRRLYNTQSSSYITLDHLARMTREGIDFRVLDAKTGTDITHQILTQIIMEEEASGEQMLPVNFLRQLIGMYGNSMQGLIPHYLEASMEQFRANQMKLRKAFEDSMEANPLARLAQQNIAMFQAAAAAFMPGAEGGVPAKGMDQPGEAAPTAAPAAGKEDLDVLRAQMLEMQKKLDSLTK